MQVKKRIVTQNVAEWSNAMDIWDAKHQAGFRKLMTAIEKKEIMHPYKAVSLGSKFEMVWWQYRPVLITNKTPLI